MQYQFAFNGSEPVAGYISASSSSLSATIIDSAQQASNSEFYLAHQHHQHQHHIHHQLTSQNQPLFNVHEIWAISIATICFVVGFPSNLISIIVCLRSLVRKPVLTRQRLVHQKNGAYNNYRGVFRAGARNNNNNNGYGPGGDAGVTVSLFSPDDNQNNINNQNGVEKYHQYVNSNNVNNNNNNNGVVKSGSIVAGNMMSGVNGSRRPGARCRLLINLNLKQKQQQQQRKDSTRSLPPNNNNNQKSGFSAIKLTRNPHRHCFELYLIEICFCDIFILAYFFLECMLLVLTRIQFIDPMYAEPVLISKFMCQFIIGFNRTITLMHNWLVSSLALTRCYAIYKPLNSHANFGQKFYLRLNLFVLVSLIFVFSTLNILGVMPLEYKRLGEKFSIFFLLINV